MRIVVAVGGVAGRARGRCFGAYAARSPEAWPRDARAWRRARPVLRGREIGNNRLSLLPHGYNPWYWAAA